ncbi:DUF4256 domain-containing protein [Aurantibacter crassamenti]|uniref:DUF4256 domain-containing protein n=1 Tax=Aurantibacter crassamenti TaxID=1837375 RepID=UPI00193A23CF|nr:DUF4256 domain-containing protein [Aurantibacter crassamenti]MBM1106159.1 DUF4256 domain-containing protein [Aurantibacter crassamenti]
MNKKLTSEQTQEILSKLKVRFAQNMHRHEGLNWTSVLKKLEANTESLWSLNEMEKTGGEPDIVILENSLEDLFFYDCSKESPAGRRSLCYDKAALESRKKFKPKNNVVDMAKAMGVTITTEAEYRGLQMIENFDTKTSSWLKTPDKIRNLGGAIFGDFRFDTVFVYHNGAESYYAARGFRASLKL